MNQLTWVWSKKPANLEEIQNCVGQGWADLVKKLIEQMLELGWCGEVIQVKEKFGGLRFYCNTKGDSAVQTLVQEAEAQSFKICENCGKPGSPKYGGWIRTLCDDCCKPNV